MGTSLPKYSNCYCTATGAYTLDLLTSAKTRLRSVQVSLDKFQTRRGEKEKTDNIWSIWTSLGAARIYQYIVFTQKTHYFARKGWMAPSWTCMEVAVLLALAMAAEVWHNQTAEAHFSYFGRKRAPHTQVVNTWCSQNLFLSRFCVALANESEVEIDWHPCWDASAGVIQTAGVYEWPDPRGTVP